MPHRFVLASFVLALSALACDSRPPSGPIPVHPVSGQVTSKGKPVADVLVIFHRDPPESSSPEPDGMGSTKAPVPTGKTDAEGRFRIHTYIGDDGAPVGQYKVTIVPSGSSEGRNLMAKNSAVASSVPLRAEYADPARTRLTATVNAADNVLPPYEL